MVDHFSTYLAVTNNNAQSVDANTQLDLTLLYVSEDLAGSFTAQTGLLTYGAGETKQFLLNLTGSSDPVTPSKNEIIYFFKRKPHIHWVLI